MIPMPEKPATDIRTALAICAIFMGIQEYAVLIGEDSDIVGKIGNIDVLVIDAAYFTGEDIAILKENGIKEIYTYLNVGSIEDFRPYYEEYEQYTLGPYENWPEERWIDVSNTEWQDFIKTRFLQKRWVMPISS